MNALSRYPTNDAIRAATTYVPPHERRAQLIPNFERLDESYIDYGYRQERARDALISARIPASFWADGVPPDFLEAVEKIRGEEFFRDACKFHNFTDREICQLADETASIIQQDYPEFTNRKARRAVRNIKRQSVEQTAHNLLLVGKGRKFLMATSFNQIERDQQNARNLRSLQNMQIRTPSGQILQVSDLAQQAQKARAAEIFCTIKGMEQLAAEQGMRWAMLTLTASPGGHPSAKTYSGQPMTDSAAEILDKLRNVHKELARGNVNISGCRTAEFHKDGCPHLHLVMFFYEDDRQKIIDALDKKFTVCYKKDDHGEEGRPTCNWIDGDSKKSKPASYAMKYVLKTMFADQTNPDPKSADEMAKIDALHSTWGIRRFAFFGIGNRTTWREARKANVEDVPEFFAKTRKLIELAKSNNAADFIKEIGGLGVKNSTRPVKISVIDRGDFREIIFREKIKGDWDEVKTTRQKMVRLGLDGRDVVRHNPNELQGRALIYNYSSNPKTDPEKAKNYDPKTRFLSAIRLKAFFKSLALDRPEQDFRRPPEK